jgi:uncharacterized protein YdeI (YjbR/CyaY-like superfamily)
MPTTDPRIDDYIERSADFAKPILVHIRGIIHTACPEVEEKIKWSMPFFDYKGPLCNMASFKQHCAFGFWKQSLIEGGDFPEKNAMGSFGRITSVNDLPDDKTLISLIQEAVRLNENGVKVPKKAPAERKELIVPDDLKKALKTSARARETFDNFSYSHRKDYIEWIEEAKTQATRDKRLAATVQQLEEGKSRNWKYEK